MSNGDDHQRVTIAKLHEWIEDTDRGTSAGDTDDGSKYYVATIRRKAATLHASVRIDVRYPAIPPLWTLQPSSSSIDGTATTTGDASGSSSGGGGAKSWSDRHGTSESLHGNSVVGGSDHSLPPLYDAMLGQIEANVNTMNNDNYDNDDDDDNNNNITSMRNSCSLFRDDVEETYDWIIVHQLREIVINWDAMQQTLHDREAVSNIDVGCQKALDGGRMRRGRDRLPIGFDMYRNGL